MRVLPSIDFEAGRVVKRVRGVRGTGIDALGRPPEWVRRWAAAGAGRIHLVDLDAAEGAPPDLDVVRAVVRSSDRPVQFGGGCRDETAIRALLAAGIDRVVLSTAAWEDADRLAAWIARFGRRVGVALDIDGERLRVRGWTGSGPSLRRGLDILRRSAPTWIILTEIRNEGTLDGFAKSHLATIRRAFDGEILVAGGISTRDELVDLARSGVDGAIVGRALYDGTLPIEVLREEFP